MPDMAKDSSEKGLYDEQTQIVDNLWANKQNADCRWVELFERPHSRSDSTNNARKVGFGRIVVNNLHMASNPWVQNSELARYGRAGDCAVVTLPRISELLTPTTADPDSSPVLTERLRPSPEQAAAQKGSPRMESVILSLFKGMKIDGPVVLTCPTGYVEDIGSAALDLA